MTSELTQQLEEFVHLKAEEIGLELVGVTINYKKGGPSIDVYADKERGGITLEECTLLNKRIVQDLDRADWFDKNYALSVSSPGVDWPLRTEKDFKRSLHRKVRFLLIEPIEDQWEYMGEITEVGSGCIHVDFETKTKEGKKKVIARRQVIIPIEKIKKALQVI